MLLVVSKEKLLNSALSLAPEGLALEFGVGYGNSLKLIAAQRPGNTIGFDSFDGLPSDWREGFPKGTFKTEPPDVPGAELRIGLFHKTLPVFLESNREDISFVHVDCDLYESAKDVLETLERHIVPGGVIVFDELVGYEGWMWHEHQALLQWVAKFGVVLEPLIEIVKAPIREQAAFRVVEYV